MKLLAPGMRTAIVVHGVEVWTALPAIRRWSLQSADRILALSEDTLSRALRDSIYSPAKDGSLRGVSTRAAIQSFNRLPVPLCRTAFQRDE